MRTSETEPFTRIFDLYEGKCALHTPKDGKNPCSRYDFLPLKGREHFLFAPESGMKHRSHDFLPLRIMGKKTSHFFAESSAKHDGRCSA